MTFHIYIDIDLKKNPHKTSNKKAFRKNVKRCRDDYAKKHSNKMPKTFKQGVGLVVQPRIDKTVKLRQR